MGYGDVYWACISVTQAETCETDSVYLVKNKAILISQVIKNNETIGQKYQYFSANIKMPILSH